jgi:hypothetical protein
MEVPLTAASADRRLRRASGFWASPATGAIRHVHLGISQKQWVDSASWGILWRWLKTSSLRNAAGIFGERGG